MDIYKSTGQLWQSIKRMTAGWKFNRSQTACKQWIKRGIALNNDGKHHEAIVCYDTAIRIDPNHSMAWSFRGGALLKLGKLREARESFQKFVRCAPPEHAAHVSEAKEIIREIKAILKKRHKGRQQGKGHKKS